MYGEKGAKELIVFRSLTNRMRIRGGLSASRYPFLMLQLVYQSNIPMSITLGDIRIVICNTFALNVKRRESFPAIYTCPYTLSEGAIASTSSSSYGHYRLHQSIGRGSAEKRMYESFVPDVPRAIPAVPISVFPTNSRLLIIH